MEMKDVRNEYTVAFFLEKRIWQNRYQLENFVNFYIN